MLVWNHIFFIYAAPALLLAAFVWWSLKDLGKEGGPEPGRDLRGRFRDFWILLKNPVILGLVAAATLRGIGLNALFHWTPFYLEDELGMGHFEAGFHYALLTGTGIISGPILGILSDRLGRKMVLIPGLVIAAALTLLVVSTGDSVLLALVLAGIGMFSFALHHIIQAALLDVVGRGTEATATGLLFGLNGVVGGVSPFLSLAIIEYLGGYGSIFYYVGIVTAVSALIMALIPLRPNPTALPSAAR